MAGGRVYRSSGSAGVQAYDARGGARCSGGIPRTCMPLWAARPGDGSALADPLVADGNLLAFDLSGRAYAFDAAGVSGCAGSPGICAPRWRTATLGIGLTGTASGGILYRTTSPDFASTVLAAYDLGGVQNCGGAPVVCQPLWIASLPGWSFSAPAVSGGTVYVATPDGVSAFDAAGNLNCTGAPRTCTPVWRGAASSMVATGPVTVANGLAFVAAGGPRQVVGFDAAGTRNCNGAPKTCLPVWVAKKAGPDLAVANGTLYTRTDAGLSAFDATAATNCSGAGVRTCHRLWRYDDADCTGQSFPCTRIAPAVVANGVLYRNWVNPDGSASLAAYDATGTTNCTGSPALCQPLRTWTGGDDEAGPVVADGFVYTRGTNDEVQAFGLP